MEWVIQVAGNVANVVLKQTGPEQHFVKKTFFGSMVFKRILRFLGYYVIRYEMTMLPECKKNACNNPCTWVRTYSITSSRPT